MSYNAGTHLIATLYTGSSTLLERYAAFQELVNTLIEQHQLQKLGEVYHDFQPAGYTAVVCLSESHLSVHTWPEYGKLNIDIYLSNYLRNNDGTVRAIYKAIVDHFRARIEDEQIIRR
jgi:S-adenosylmethionine decarboxylase